MRHAFKAIAAAAFAIALTGTGAIAQTVGLGTTKGGATAQVSAAIAKVVSDAGAVQVRPQAMGNTSQYIPVVNAGKLELGISNFPQYRFAKEGTGMSKEPNPNLMLVANLFPFRVGLAVPKKLGLKTYADLKGPAGAALSGQFAGRFPDPRVSEGRRPDLCGRDRGRDLELPQHVGRVQTDEYRHRHRRRRIEAHL